MRPLRSRGSLVRGIKTTQEESIIIDKKIDRIFGLTPEILGDKGDIYAPSHVVEPLPGVAKETK